MAGKFSAKNREHAVDVRTILAEREQAQQRRSGAPAAPQKRKPAQPAEPANPRSQKNARSTKKAVKGPRLGGVIFYTIFLLFIFLFYISAKCKYSTNNFRCKFAIAFHHPSAINAFMHDTNYL